MEPKLAVRCLQRSECQRAPRAAVLFRREARAQWAVFVNSDISIRSRQLASHDLKRGCPNLFSAAPRTILTRTGTAKDPSRVRPECVRQSSSPLLPSLSGRWRTSCGRHVLSRAWSSMRSTRSTTKRTVHSTFTELRHGLAPPGLLGCARRCQRYRVRNYRSTIIHDGSSEAHSAAEFSRILEDSTRPRAATGCGCLLAACQCCPWLPRARALSQA